MGFLPLNLRGAWVVVGAAALALGLAGVDRLRQRPETAPLHSDWETDPALWGRLHPREYGTWKLGREARPERGADALDPMLFAGHGAGADGVEPRAPGHPAACPACHDPATMELRVTQPAFLGALARQGVEPARLGPAERRLYVCVQCHAATSTEGLEWRHAISGTPLVKLRHPEFDLWREGIHAQRNVTCPDCHMPQVSEGTVRFADHRLGSPAEGLYDSCMTCHHGGEAALRARVQAIQEATRGLQARAAQALREAHGALGRVRASDEVLEPLRLRLRKAQLRWEAVAAEGSRGFHAPQEAARLLGESIDLARQVNVEARRLATR